MKFSIVLIRFRIPENDLLLTLYSKVMSYQFRIISKNEFDQIIPLVFVLNEERVERGVLKSRFQEMKNQNYECAGVYDNTDNLIGICGLWFCTRHYIRRSVELDHVYIKPEYRNKGLGHHFMHWIQNYIKQKGCQSMELNTYVQNYASHKFYYNEGYEILGYHFLKKL